MSLSTLPIIKVLHFDDRVSNSLSGFSFKNLLQETTALVFRNFFSSEESRLLVKQLYNLKNLWIPSIARQQHSFGRVWYAHLDDGMEGDYFRGAEESNQRMETYFPGLYQKLCSFCAKVQSPEPVKLRKGWAGPGFVIYLCPEQSIKISGARHYDWPGLTVEQLSDPSAESYTFISMLQKPELSGGLKIWDVKYDPTRDKETILKNLAPPLPKQEGLVIDYQVGDLVAFNSFSLHQVQPFGGDVDRITLLFQMARHGKDWYIWF